MRTKTTGKPKMVTSVRVRMDEQLKKRLEQVASIYSLDVSDIARMAFTSFLSQQQRPLVTGL